MLVMIQHCNYEIFSKPLMGRFFPSACERRLSHKDIIVFCVVKIEFAYSQTGINLGDKTRQTKIREKKRRAGVI